MNQKKRVFVSNVERMAQLHETFLQTSLMGISQRTAIKPEDIISTLESLSLLKHFKGQVVADFTVEDVAKHLHPMEEKLKKRADMFVKPELIRWTPKHWEEDTAGVFSLSKKTK